MLLVTGSLVITIYGLPWICLILIPLVPVYHWLQNHYRLTSRELKRISSVTLSPVYSHFNETLQGEIRRNPVTPAREKCVAAQPNACEGLAGCLY